MPELFLIAAIVGACFTANLHWPVRRPATAALVSFFAGWLTGELALHHLLWQAVATLIFVLLGALDDWPGVLGLAITGLSWVGLVVSHVQSRRAGAVIFAALADGLGEGREKDDGDWKLDWAGLLRVFPIRRPDVERHRDVVYAREGNLRLRLDIYRHQSRPTGCPVLIYVHGGGWVIGNKDQQGLVTVSHMAARGWVCVSINYRLSPRSQFPAHLVDVKRAIAWVKTHIAEYGGDASFVAIAGGSAGAHLAALASLTPGDPEYQPGFEEADTAVQACVAYYGIYDFTDRFGHWPYRGFHRLLGETVMQTSIAADPEAYERASPMSRVHATAPPLLVFHGDKDTLAPVAEARELVRAYRQVARGPLVYVELPGAHHAFEIFPSVRSFWAVRGTERFLSHVHRLQALHGT